MASVICGSIAYDTIMTFDGHFREHILPDKIHILNVLHRLLDGKPAPAPVTSPQALKLSVEPQANVLRYDQLREVRYAS